MAGKRVADAAGHVRSFARALLLPTLLLFVIPLATLGVAEYGRHVLDGRALSALRADIAADPEILAGDKPGLIAAFEALPPSAVCWTLDPAAREYRAALCAPFSPSWQMEAGWVGSILTIALGAAGVIAALLLGTLAFVIPRLQYPIFVVGRFGFTALSGVMVTVQGGLAVWLSYWATALLTESYYPQLILVAVALAGMGVVAALVGLYQRVPQTEVEGEPVDPSRNSALWSRLHGLAERVGTEPPSTVIAGIDDNFFVAESPLQVGATTVAGRTLFVSVPLLRVLSDTEADAVLAHELAHLRGGDTRLGARLGPAVARYDAYLQALRQGGLATFPVLPLLTLFRAVFELARSRESRRRELVADRISAQTVSVDDAVQALCKVAAYSSHRATVERELFAFADRHGEKLGIKDRVAGGLRTHVDSEEFREAIAGASIPHPFDSHPPLDQRLRALGSAIDVTRAADLFAEPPAHSWAALFPDATAIEDRLWSSYEARFNEAHLESLAYRYLPTTDEQRALVEAHFPRVAFPSKRGVITLTYEYLENVDGKRLPLAEIAKASLHDGTFRSTLRLHHRPDASAGPGPTVIVLSALTGSGAKLNFQEVFTRYWRRDQIARHAS